MVVNQDGRKLIFWFLITGLFIPAFVVVPSCNSDMITPAKEVSLFTDPEKLAGLTMDAEIIKQDIGEIHNGIIKRFYLKRNTKFADRIPLDEFSRIFLESVNEEFQTRGLNVMVNNADMDLLISKAKKFLEDTRIDLFNPENINPSAALDILASKHYLTREDALYCKSIVNKLDKNLRPLENDCGLIPTMAPSETVRNFENIITGSYNLWTEEIIELGHQDVPDTSGFDWIAYLEKIGPYIADGLGGIGGGLLFAEFGPIASIIAGGLFATFASIAFETITFFGDEGL